MRGNGRHRRHWHGHCMSLTNCICQHRDDVDGCRHANADAHGGKDTTDVLDMLAHRKPGSTMMPFSGVVTVVMAVHADHIHHCHRHRHRRLHPQHSQKNGPVDPVLSDVWLVVGLGRR